MNRRLKKPYYKAPRGGWHLPYDGITFTGPGPDEVIAKVQAYLLANNRPPTDVMALLVDYCAVSYPLLVEPDYDNAPPPDIDPLARVMEQNRVLSRRPLDEIPEQKEISRRFSACLGCPHHAKIRGPLEQDVFRSSFILTKGKMDPLGYCTAHGWDCRVAVRWDSALLQPASAGSIPGCWL
jgi:hypothetical protein